MRLPYIRIIKNYSNGFILVITQYPQLYVVDKYFIFIFCAPILMTILQVVVFCTTVFALSVYNVLQLTGLLKNHQSYIVLNGERCHCTKGMIQWLYKY